MHILQGIAVSPGIAIGEALIVDNERFRIPRRFVMRDAVDAEWHRLEKAIDAVAAELEDNRRVVTNQLGEQYGAIFAAHLQMLRDPRLQRELVELIRQRHYSPEYAVSQVMRRYAKVFQDLKSDYLAERAHDIFDIEQRLLNRLLGANREELTHLTAAAVVLAHDLTPSETALLDPNFVLGFATEIGGAGGHTAIVAKGLEIPAVVGVGAFLSQLSGGDLVVIDGNHGRVVCQPDDEMLARYRREVESRRSLVSRLDELRELPAETLDGCRIKLAANIEFPREVAACVQRGADGIGLYRTEFLYLASANEPSEEDHYEAYREVLQAMHGRPVVFRTLDLGADKLGRLPCPEQERNPFLGLRSIRLSLRDLPPFRTQLRALLRASVLGPTRIMFPLIATLDELRRAKAVLAQVQDELAAEGVEFDREVQVGMMVEVPSAVILLDRFLAEVDFISVGTNDLVQYALAVDRTNPAVASLYQATDPAVLRLLDLSLQSARRANVPASVCGQMSAEGVYSMLLLGLGLREFSLPPSSIPQVKRICRAVSIPQCQQVAQRALELASAAEIDAYVRDELRKIAPELAARDG
jgi:phosphotransferase system enzyme I (PtsI)